MNKYIILKHIKNNWLLWLFCWLSPALIISLILLILKITTTDNNITGVTNSNIKIIEMMFESSTPFILPAIFSVVIANRLICSPIHSGAITYVMISVRRLHVILSKLIFIFCSNILGLFAMLFINLPIICIFKTDINISPGYFTIIAFGWFLLISAISSIAYMISITINSVILSYGTSFLIIFSFFILFTLGTNIGGKLEFLKYFTINNLAIYTNDTCKLPNISTIISKLMALILIISGLYVAGTIKFCKKDLQL